MKLYWSPRSPFVRKALIAAHETGLIAEIELIPSIAMATQPRDELLAVNPLGQIPVLLADGEAIYDSSTICYYLDAVRGSGALHPSDPCARLSAERRHALGDGLSELLLHWLTERTRQQENQSAIRIAAANKKLPYIFQALEKEAADFGTQPFDIGHVAIIAALGYLDFRFPSDWDWRDRFPTLSGWWDHIQTRPSVAATKHYDELVDGGAAAKARS